MQNKARMVNRLPEYMNATDRDSLLHSLLDSIGIELERSEDRVTDIMTSKWFPVASLPDLERIGSLFGVERLTGEELRAYKQRLYSTVQELLKGIGTVESIRILVTATMGFEPEIIENPNKPITGGPRLLKAGDKWVEECQSVLEPKPIITIHALTTVRNPTIANLMTGDSVSYNGLLRSGAFLVIHPDGRASLAGINVTDRIVLSQNVLPSISRPTSEWVYQDLNAFLDSSKFGEATLAGEERYSVIVQLRWEEAKPASFIVKLPLYSNKYRPTEELSDRELHESIGYEQELRQEVRNLVEKVKTAGVEAQINFWDDFVEKITIKDEVRPQFNNISEDAHALKEELTIESEATLHELHEIKDRLDIAGAFDITTFDSENRFG